MRFRNIEPAIYNERRLNEQPIPEFNAENGLHALEDYNEYDEMIAADDTMIEPLEENTASEYAQSVRIDLFNRNNIDVGVGLDSIQDSKADDVNDGDGTHSEIDVKLIVPLYTMANNDAIINQLQEHETIIVEDSSDDDMEIKVGPKGFGKPLGATLDDLIKRETPDEISGDMPFIQKVCSLFFIFLRVISLVFIVSNLSFTERWSCV